MVPAPISIEDKIRLVNAFDNQEDFMKKTNVYRAIRVVGAQRGKNLTLIMAISPQLGLMKASFNDGGKAVNMKAVKVFNKSIFQ